MAKLKTPPVTIIEYGHISFDDDGKIYKAPIYQIGEVADERELEKLLVERAEEIGNWFIQQAHEQYNLPGFC